MSLAYHPYNLQLTLTIPTLLTNTSHCLTTMTLPKPTHSCASMLLFFAAPHQRRLNTPRSGCVLPMVLAR